MDKIEASGRTTEEAVQIAARQLGVSVDAVEYEVVEEGAKGFLGLGQTPSLIKAWVKEGYAPQARAEAPTVQTYTEEAFEEQAEEEAEEEAMVEDIVQEERMPVSVSGDEIVDAVMRVLSDVVKAMGLDAKTILISSNEDEVQIEIAGQDVAILIGKQGQTLDALQYLVGMIVNKGIETRRRIILDAEGYRARHQEMLERKAHEYADAVKAEGKEAVLEPQPARDRRIVHLALADDPDIYTYSEGMGDDRHVVISPKK